MGDTTRSRRALGLNSLCQQGAVVQVPVGATGAEGGPGKGVYGDCLNEIHAPEATVIEVTGESVEPSPPPTFPLLPLRLTFRNFMRDRRMFTLMERFAPGSTGPEWEKKHVHPLTSAMQQGWASLLGAGFVNLSRVYRDDLCYALRSCMTRNEPELFEFLLPESIDGLKDIFCAAIVEHENSEFLCAFIRRFDLMGEELMRSCIARIKDKPTRLERLRLLLEAGSKELSDFLITSCAEDDPAMLKLLLEYGAKPSWKALHCAALSSLECTRILIEAGADVNWRDCYERTVLHQAVHAADPSVLCFLLPRFPDINARIPTRMWTPLHEACAGSHVEAVTVLLAAGADLTLRDSAGRGAAEYIYDSRVRDVAQNHQLRCLD